MAEVKISALSSATTPLAGTEVVPIVQGGVTKKVAVSSIGGGGTNPTSTYIPYNNSGSFIDSNFVVIPDTIYGSSPFGYYSRANPVFGGGYNTYVDDNNALYSFGSASINNFTGGSAFAGLAINNGVALIGCNMGNPSDGVFKADMSNGFIRIGNSDSLSIGIDTNSSKLRVGSTLITTGTHVTISRWLKVITETGTSYYLPLYS